MIKRCDKTEGIFKSWLNGLDTMTLAPIKLSYAASAAVELAKATGDESYGAFAVKVADEFKEKLETGALEEGNLANLKLANMLYFAAAKTGDASYIEAAKKAAELIAKQPRSAEGVFVNKGSDACNGDVCICQAYLSQVFYMKYESTNGGKERYNDIIAQYNAYRANYYEAKATKMSQDATAAKVVALFAAALIDTMEVIDQPMYEMFRRMQALYKEAVKDIIKSDVFTNADMAAVMASYAVLKGCRMKALHTEKYEDMALRVLKASLDNAMVEDKSEDAGYMAALAMSYSESLKNREYQDYGRGKGGALWS